MSLVQPYASNTTGSSSGLTSLTVTLGSSTTPGNCLIVCLSALTEGGGAPTVTSVHLGGVVDNFAVAKSNSGGSSGIVAIYTDQNLQVSSTLVAIVVSGASSINASVFEWSGIKASGAVDKTNAGTTSSSSSFSSGSSGTLTQALEVAFGVTGIFSSGADTINGPASPWINTTQITSNDPVLGFPYDQMSGYQSVSATTALTYSGTNTGGSFTNTAIATLELVPPPAPHIRPAFQATKRASFW